MNVTITRRASFDGPSVTIKRELGTSNGTWEVDWNNPHEPISELVDKSLDIVNKIGHESGLLAGNEHFIRRNQGVVTRWDVVLIAGAAVLACVIASKLMR